jgi:Concanavalin A-like lectin/glucanases superfamily/Dockerin type I domain
MKRQLLSYVALAATVAMSLAAVTQANTLAYWRFEDGTAGSPVSHTTAAGVFDPGVLDTSGNGHHLSAWTQGGCCGFEYRADVPETPVTQTGAANTLSVKNTGGFPTMWTTGTSMQTIEPAAFTIEASFKPENGGFRTVVGRDSQGAATSNPSLAALYLQAVPGNAVAIKFTDKAGFFHEAVSAPGAIQGFDFPTDPDGLLGRWYHLAGVSNGSTLSLYLDDVNAGAGYQLVAQIDLTLSGSTNTALTMGTGSGGDWTAGNWSVGRGLYNGGHVDRAYGFIDEVRISDTALAPSQFLFSTPGGVPGDYNGNNVVDAADYVVWRNNLGLMGGATPSQGDGTGDGNVTSADYDYWKARFGNLSGNGGSVAQSTVPEPATVILVVLTAVGWCLCRRRAA